MSDPTRIDIEFDRDDPRGVMMRGVAIHGNTPFECPYISQITEDLWQGGCSNGLVLPDHIVNVVSLYPWERYKARHKLNSELYVRLYDDLEGPNTDQIIGIARYVNTCRKTGPTLVHCQAGLNRSGMVAAVALMLGDGGMFAKQAIRLLRETRSPAVLCNPSFVEWLENLEGLL